MKLQELFATDVTRTIPPVVYFHDQSPERLKDEVSEYIVTGGYRQDDPRFARVRDGIHEQYVHLLGAMTRALSQPHGPSLPNAWISGFYGSGKSSFAKLLGMSLDGLVLPDGQPLSKAWLARDTSPRAQELQQAWDALQAKLDQSIAVVFDIGGVSRGEEHIHEAVLRRVQKRLGYSSVPAVAAYELRLERDGEYPAFLQAAQAHLSEPWEQASQGNFADDDFSLVMHKRYPDRFDSSEAWFRAHAAKSGHTSAEEAVRAIRDMLQFRAPQATLFIVIDEVSQYIHQDHGRMLKLQSFASELGARLKGRVWMLALGQQKLDEASDQDVLGKMKDRFPRDLRVHLGTINIRDVVYQRLLRKTPDATEWLRQQWSLHGPSLELYAWWEKGQDKRADDWIETYPLMPGHIDLLMRITTALRTRSSKARGDDQAIRGLLQLLGELFRSQGLATQPAGTLITLDQVYEVLHTALDADTERTMERIFRACRGSTPRPLMEATAKAVALLQLIQDTEPTTASLVARCLYDRIDRGDRSQEVEQALEELRRENLLGFREKSGYRIQSSAGEEWEGERKQISVGVEKRTALVQTELHRLATNNISRPKLENRAFSWRVLFSAGGSDQDTTLVRTSDLAHLTLDLRLLPRSEAKANPWIQRSGESSYSGRILWVSGPGEQLEDLARELGRSKAMISRYEQRGELPHEKRRLLLDEKGRAEDLAAQLRRVVEQVWMSGALYWRGRQLDPAQVGSSFADVMLKQGTAVLGELFPHHNATTVTEKELLPLAHRDIAGLDAKFTSSGLGLFDQEPSTGRWEPTCTGNVPQRVLARIQEQGGVSGDGLLNHFGRAPYGYHPSVLKACCAALLRARKIQVRSGLIEITSIRDQGAKETLTKDRDFKAAEWFLGQDVLDPRAVRKLASVLERSAGELGREPEDLADAVSQRFPQFLTQLRQIQSWLDRIHAALPPELEPLESILETGIQKSRRTQEVLRYLTAKTRLQELRSGTTKLAVLCGDLSEQRIHQLVQARQVLDNQLSQMDEEGVLPPTCGPTAQRLREHLNKPAPWQGVEALDSDLSQLREAYQQERGARLALQGTLAEQTRESVKASTDQWSKLTPEQKNRVLRPIANACIDSPADAIQPPLSGLSRPQMERNLARGRESAIERLDEILEQIHRVPITPLDLRALAAHRKVTTPQEAQAFVDQLHQAILDELNAGRHVRLS